jgi:hypothetical protein
MNVTLPEFKRIVLQNNGTAYAVLTVNGFRLTYRLDVPDQIATVTLHSTQYKERYFKTASALHTFLIKHFPETIFRILCY